jgi:hypothetical protein
MLLHPELGPKTSVWDEMNSNSTAWWERQGWLIREERGSIKRLWLKWGYKLSGLSDILITMY